MTPPRASPQAAWTSHLSYTVFEHIPVVVLEQILHEANRVLSDRGAAIHHIDLSDHFFQVEIPTLQPSISCSIRRRNGIVTRVISGATITACACKITGRSTAKPARSF